MKNVARKNVVEINVDTASRIPRTGPQLIFKYQDFSVFVKRKGKLVPTSFVIGEQMICAYLEAASQDELRMYRKLIDSRIKRPVTPRKRCKG